MRSCCSRYFYISEYASQQRSEQTWKIFLWEWTMQVFCRKVRMMMIVLSVAILTLDIVWSIWRWRRRKISHIATFGEKLLSFLCCSKIVNKFFSLLSPVSLGGSLKDKIKYFARVLWVWKVVGSFYLVLIVVDCFALILSSLCAHHSSLAWNIL